MKIGVTFPQHTIGFDAGVVRDFAATAEGLGFDYIACLDHVLGTAHEHREPPFPPGGIYDESSIFHEPLTLFAFMTAVTSRIEFVTAVLVLPQRQTALVAKQAAEIVLLSGNRLRLGVGSGWNHIEYESLTTDYATRGRRLEEQVDVLRRLWTERSLDIDAEFHRIDRASLNPLLDRPVPIWFGGFAHVVQDRCARIGDGMLWTGNTSLSRRGNEWIRERATALGRDGDAIGFQAGITAKEGETLIDAIAAWEAAGGTHATVAVDRHLEGAAVVDALPALRREVGPFISAT